MPSRPPYLISQPSARDPQTLPNAPALRPNTNKALPPPPMSTLDYQIPTLQRKARQEYPDSSSSKHNRSISHPFPSFFGSIKKSQRKNTLKQAYSGIDSTDDEISVHGDPGGPEIAKAPSRPQSNKSENEAATGRCMTCSSTVQWPRGLKVYRCTICLTINDLEPFLDHAGGPRAQGSTPASRVPRKRR